MTSSASGWNLRTQRPDRGNMSLMESHSQPSDNPFRPPAALERRSSGGSRELTFGRAALWTGGIALTQPLTGALTLSEDVFGDWDIPDFAFIALIGNIILIAVVCLASTRWLERRGAVVLTACMNVAAWPVYVLTLILISGNAPSDKDWEIVLSSSGGTLLGSLTLVALAGRSQLKESEPTGDSHHDAAVQG